jgi:glutamate/aspartate transport system permease protein
MYAAVTVLYIISAMAINRIMAWVEKKVRVPGFVVAGGTGGH